MDSGFGINLEGTLIKSNLSVLPNDYNINIADGSLEVCGKIYTDTILPFTNMTNGTIALNGVEFSPTQVYIPYTNYGVTSSSLLVEGGLSILNTSENALLVNGSGVFQNNLTVYGHISAELNRILLVADPIDSYDAVNLEYLNYRLDTLNITIDLSRDQVIFCGNTSGKLSGSSYFTYETSSSTLNVLNLNVNTLFSTSGSINVLSNISMNNLYISDVHDPLNPQDVATKHYVDSRPPNASVSAGQLIVTGTDGSSFIGYQELVFSQTSGTNVLNIKDTFVEISGTRENLGIGSGGTLYVYGGINVSGESFMTGLDAMNHNITSVDSPIRDYDAVNKAYVHNILNTKNIRITNYTLENDKSTPTSIPNFRMGSALVAVLIYIHIHDTLSGVSSLYVMHSWNANSLWDSNIVNVFNRITGISFNILSNTNYTLLQYTNTNTEGNYVINFYTISEVYDNTLFDQYTFTLLNQTSDFTNTIINLGDTSSNEYTVYLKDSFDNYGMCMINCSAKIPDTPKTWGIAITRYGDIQNVNWKVSYDGYLQYTNMNENDITVIIKNSQIQKSQYTLMLQPTVTRTIIQDTHLQYPDTISFIRNVVYVFIPDINKSATYFLEGYFTDGVWYLNSKFIGDYTGIRFYITTIGNIGYVQYTNLNNTYSVIKFGIVNYDNINPVSLGGTGSGWLEPNCVLRGNGIDPIIATTDFIYTDKVLTLGEESSIHIFNSSQGAFICNGGAHIQRLSVNNVNMVPNIDDIFEERVFNASNNISTFMDISDISFANSRAFEIFMRVEITTSSDTLENLSKIQGLRRANGEYRLNISRFGDNVNIIWGINTFAHNLQYKSSYVTDWISTSFHYTMHTLKTSS